jgi:hypothetical protein
MTFSEFIDAALSESGKISFGRLASLILILACVAWDSAYILFVVLFFQKYRFAVGDVLPPASILLSQVSFFLAPYTVTKVKSAVDKRAANPENGQSQ